MFDVVAIGELLIDFIPAGRSVKGYPLYEMYPGGAPVNCLAVLNALGAKTAFIGKVGEDQFGSFLVNNLKAVGINADGVMRENKTTTTLAFVHLGDDGERSFSFIRNPGADTLLKKEDVDVSIIDQSRIVHFGSVSLTHEPSRHSVLYAVGYAKKKGKLISYDPNYRPLLWKNERDAVEWMIRGLAYADIVKVSEEELMLITEESDIEKGSQWLLSQGAKMVFVTIGEKGAYFCSARKKGFVQGFNVKAIDTTGCGDAFLGAVLYNICRNPDMPLNEIVRFANAAGALCAMKRGGFPYEIKKDDVEQLLHCG